MKDLFPENGSRSTKKHQAERNGKIPAETVRAKLEKEGFRVVAVITYGPDLRKVRLEKAGKLDGNGKPEKTFRWEHLESGKWWAGDGGRGKPLYVNALFREQDQLGLVIGFEGEAKADLAGELGFPAFSFKDFTSAHCELLSGCHAVFSPDKDTPGDRQCTQAATILNESKQASSIRIIAPPEDLPVGGDLVDGVRSLGWDRARIQHLIDDAKPFPEKPPLVGVLLSEVKPEKVVWLWKNWMPLGKITTFDGDPGLGKSLLALEITARITTGRPLTGDDVGVSGGAVILTAADGLADTVVPRLMAAGADLSRIVALRYAPDKEGEKTVSNIPVDIPVIQSAIERVKAKLVVVDVLMAYLPSDTNSYRDQDVRLALAPLAQLADRMGVAFICIRHLTKAPGGNPIYSGGGSIEIIGGARAGMLVARDPDNPDVIVLAQTKSNLGPPMPSLTYQIEPNGDGIPRTVWKGNSHQTATSLLAVARDEEERGAMAEAKDFLRDELFGGAKRQSEVKAAARQAGIADATLRRAKHVLGVKSCKIGLGMGGEEGKSYWVWEFPNSSEYSQGTHSRNMSTFGKNGVQEDALITDKSATSSKVPKMLTHEDAQMGMSTFGEAQRFPLEEPDYGEI